MSSGDSVDSGDCEERREEVETIVREPIGRVQCPGNILSDLVHCSVLTLLLKCFPSLNSVPK